MSDSQQTNHKIPGNNAETNIKLVGNNNGGGGGGSGIHTLLSATVCNFAPGADATISLSADSRIAAPNSKPREKEQAPIETYVYRDFANAEPANLNTGMCHEGRMPPQSLQSQKLPSKLAAMLSDPDLASIITWMPHGRSWKILNRELFASFALPRYFGHSNHASFVRIVNAWGFRRISIGVDRDSYFHELFLRGKPSIHQRMKRLPSCHRKTPVDKDDRCPDFYELAKASPLPEVTWSGSFSGTHPMNPGAPTSGGMFPSQMNPSSMMGNTPFMPETVKPIHYGDAAGAFSSSGLMGNGMGSGMGGMGMNSSSLGMSDNPMLAMLGIKNEQRSGNSALGRTPPTDASSLSAYTQTLQQENENLLLKIKLLEYENQAKQFGQQQQQLSNGLGNTNQQHPNINQSLGNVNANIGAIGGSAFGANNATNLNNMGNMGGAAAGAPSDNSNNIVV